jgi:hypothetical protein
MWTQDTERPAVEVPEGAAGWGGAGDVVGVLVNLAMLVAVNLWPGWQSLPFLTDDFTLALPWVNLSLAAGATAGVVYLVAGFPVVRAWGGLVTTALGLVSAVRMLQVFPIEGGDAVTVTARVLLVIAVVGSVIGILARIPDVARTTWDLGRGTAEPRS